MKFFGANSLGNIVLVSMSPSFALCNFNVTGFFGRTIFIQKGGDGNGRLHQNRLIKSSSLGMTVLASTMEQQQGNNAVEVEEESKGQYCRWSS
ncbi:hypothetical protein SAY87_018775 [Trapa incisa]|uniref:Uncharacterized protein n=1 Tax=Trapa incisa TaxID=236973 RepID=A0AAN7Q1N4_9MYRT|nr:hypothetical protein SAY87_018775 [Trapa incisa]